MVNIDIGKTEFLVIPLTGYPEVFPNFSGNGLVVLEKIIGGQSYSFEAAVNLDKCNSTATVSLSNINTKMKEGNYRMRIYMKETNKVYLTLANVKYGVSKRRN